MVMKIVSGVGSDSLLVSYGSDISVGVYANIRVSKGDVEKGESGDETGGYNLH